MVDWVNETGYEVSERPWRQMSRRTVVNLKLSEKELVSKVAFD